MPTGNNSYLSAAQEDRCSPRTRLTIPATLRASGGRAFQTNIQDLSISGFSASSINRMHEGQIDMATGQFHPFEDRYSDTLTGILVPE